VAVKLVIPGCEAKSDLDAHAAGTLAIGLHPNVVQIYYSTSIAYPGMTTIVPAVAMEWLDGQNLEHRLAGDRFSRAEADSICDGLAAGLAHIHACGLFHGDLVPSNVMVSDGHATLIDAPFPSRSDLHNHYLTSVERDSFDAIIAAVLNHARER